MKNMKTIENAAMQLMRFLFSGIISLAICSIFVLAYKNTGVHVTNPSGSTDYTWEPYQLKTVMTEGFAWLRFDENGYNNAYSGYSSVGAGKEPDILLMGSSNMEATHVGAKANTGYRLNELLPDLYTYNIGVSGHTLCTCVKNIEAALEEYKPKNSVVIETNSVELSITDMAKVVDGSYPSIISYDKGLLYVLQRRVPAVKNMYKSLLDWWDKDYSAPPGFVRSFSRLYII